MTEKRLNEAMQSNLPEAPKGFDERIDQMALDLAAGQARGVKGTRGLRTGLILAMVTVLLLGTFTAFAATNERVNTWLYEFWPEAATALMPANTSSVKEGIRLELVSAEVQDGELTMVFSLEDLEGDRIGPDTTVDATMEWEYVESRYDAEQKKLILTWNTEYEYYKDRDVFELEVALLTNIHEYHIDLQPYLKEYGSQAKLISIREEDIDPAEEEEDAGRLKSRKVLDYVNGREIPLTEYVMLSGIGIGEDGALHVQYHFPVHHRELVRIFKDRDDPRDLDEGPYTEYSYSPYDPWVYLYDTGDPDREGLPSMKKYGYGLPAWWGLWSEEESPFPEWDGKVGQYEWMEFTFTTPPEEMTEEQTLEAVITEQDPPIIGMWTIRVPERLIKKD